MFQLTKSVQQINEINPRFYAVNVDLVFGFDSGMSLASVFADNHAEAAYVNEVEPVENGFAFTTSNGSRVVYFV